MPRRPVEPIGTGGRNTYSAGRTTLRGMGEERRQIVASGGGGFSMERDNTLLDDYVLALSDSERPRVCFLPTASGDADHYVVRFYRRFSPSCQTLNVLLFRRAQ